MSNVARDFNHVFDVDCVVIDPERYLTQLLTNLLGRRSAKIERWLPDRYKLQNPSL